MCGLATCQNRSCERMTSWSRSTLQVSTFWIRRSETASSSAFCRIACRRYLMHYIDVGMDVHGEERPVIGGQVMLSSPGGPCMTCMGFLTEEKLGAEAARYGNVGARPQVVWPNGVLASTAVGFALELVTGWTRTPRPYAYMVYNGNEATLTPSKTLNGVERRACTHFSAEDLGDPVVAPL